MTQLSSSKESPLKQKILQKLNFFQNIGSGIINFLEYVGGLAILAGQTLKAPFREKSNWNETVKQCREVGVKTLPLSDLIAIFTGMVLALQLIVGLKRFGLSLYSGQVVGIGITRELGPVLTSLMVAARVGAGIASELGSMTVSEQVLAIRAMGGDPIVKLVFPRVLVCTIATPVLTVVAIFIGIFGGMLMAYIEMGLSPQFYLDQITSVIEIYDFTSGVSKTIFFGFSIGIIACYQGLNTSGGTKGVGISTTQSVVNGAVAIFVLDFLLTKLFLLF